jgi:hypothetical protein
MKWSLIVAANNEAVLASCLSRSPCIVQAGDYQVMRGFASAGAAYNAGLRQSAGEILVFAHQDVYLPPGWETRLSQAVARLSDSDPHWAVLGVFGIAQGSGPCGHLYCAGQQRVLGAPLADAIRSDSLDEVLLVLRRSSGLSFDERLPGFHLYGTDICLEARRRGLGAYIVSAFCVHNTAGMAFLPRGFWRAYFVLRRKWWDRLPIRTPCTAITRWAWPVWTSISRNFYAHYLKREPLGRRVPDPEKLYARLLAEKALTQPSRSPLGEPGCPLSENP